MAVSKVSRKGLTSIPAEVRRKLQIDEGDLLVWKIDEPRKVAVIQVLKDPFKFLEGRHRDPRLVYSEVEERADELLLGELHARNSA